MKKLSILCLLAALFLTPVTVFAQVDAPSGPVDPSEIEPFVDGIMAATMENYHVPGTIVVIVKDGEVLFAKGYGYADVEKKIPVDPTVTLFRPGSVSKLFTWTAVMQLVEQGKLDLNADINEYLDFDIPTAYDTPITLTHILTHTPGFEDNGQHLFSIQQENAISNESYVKTYIPAQVYEPGTVGSYSNYATALAGYIIERAAEMPFEEYIDEYILSPLGMTQSTFLQPLPLNLTGGMSGGYNYIEGEWVQGPFEIVNGSPAGALSASGLDMAKFMIAHLQNGEHHGSRILSEETAQKMHSLLYSPDSRIDGMAHGFFYRQINGKTVLSHGGDTMLFHSELALLPEENVGLFISTNGANGGQVVENFTNAFYDYYFPAEKEIDFIPLTSTSEQADIYNGSYTSARSSYTGIERILNLMSSSSVTVTENGEVFVNMMGREMVMVEAEPGILVDTAHPEQKLVLKKVDGQVQLHPSMPFVLIKNRWFENNLFHQALIFGTMFLLLFSTLVWVTAFFVRHKHSIEKPERLIRFSHWSAAIFFLLLIVFLIGFLVIMTDMEPAMQVPYVFFGNPPLLEALLILPIGLFICSGIILALCILQWFKQAGSMANRIFYSLLTVFCLGTVWSLSFWNLLF